MVYRASVIRAWRCYKVLPSRTIKERLNLASMCYQYLPGLWWVLWKWGWLSDMQALISQSCQPTRRPLPQPGGYKGTIPACLHQGQLSSQRQVLVKSICSELLLPQCESQSCHFHPVQTQAICLKALCLSFPICQNRGKDHFSLRVPIVLSTGPGMLFRLKKKKKWALNKGELQVYSKQWLSGKLWKYGCLVNYLTFSKIIRNYGTILGTCRHIFNNFKYPE